MLRNLPVRSRSLLATLFGRTSRPERRRPTRTRTHRRRPIGAEPLESRAMLAGMVIDGGLSWNGWTYRGLSNEAGLYGSGGTSERYEVYTVAFAFDATSTTITDNPIQAVNPAPAGFAAGRLAPTPVGPFAVSKGAFADGNTILGIGVRAQSGGSIAGFKPTLRFDLDNDSYRPASAAGATDGRTSFGSFSEQGDFTVQFEAGSSWRGSTISVQAGSRSNEGTPETTTYTGTPDTVLLPGGVGSGTSYDFAFRAFAQPAANAYQMFIDMTAIPRLYGSADPTSVYKVFFPNKAGVAPIRDRVTVSLNGLGTNNVVFGADLTLPVVTVDVSPNSVEEDADQGLTYTFTRPLPGPTPLTISYAVAGSAAAGSDFVGLPPGTGMRTITIPANLSTASITVHPLADTEIEPDETVMITLKNGTGYGLGTDRVATGTIKNDDFEVDLDVDSNRDNKIDDADEYDEDKWESGAGKSGAVILPNLDKDGTGPAPDNWSGVEDWDGDGAIDPANTKIDGNGDIDDIGPLWAKMFDLPALPERLAISLKVAVVADEDRYFETVAANRRVRIFLPSQVDNADVKVKAGDEEIIGPSTADAVQFVKTPSGAGQHAFDIFKGTGTVRFGIEGIEQGAMVDITLTVTIGDKEMGRDVVRLRVAPFVLNDHRNNVAAGTAAAPTVFVTNLGDDNKDLRETALPEAFADSVGVAAIVDPWQQDGYEIGYAQAPYAQMPVVLELPRSRMRGGELSRYVRTTLLRKDVGVNIRIPGLAGNTQDSGGNFESIPKAGGGPGYFFHGRSMTEPHRDFFEAQGVNTLREVNTDWLYVGHVDEVVSLAPSGDRVMVADPDSAWALLVWANKLDATVRMLQDMNGDGDGDGVAVADMLGDAKLRAWNFSTVMAAKNLAAIREDVAMAMGVSPPETTPLAAPANTGMAQLDKGGGLVGLFPNANVRNYEIKFTNATNYEFRYQEAGGDWSAPAVGRRDRDEVFADARAFILKHYWSGGAPTAGDVFTFTADPGAKMIEVPVLFEAAWDDRALRFKSLAYTTNFINSLVSGTTVVTGKGYGPSVNWSGAGISDIFEDYTTGTFKLAGMDEGKIVRADGRYYHNGQGFIHCGTNVIRDIPSDKWWNR